MGTRVTLMMNQKAWSYIHQELALVGGSCSYLHRFESGTNRTNVWRIRHPIDQCPCAYLALSSFPPKLPKPQHYPPRLPCLQRQTKLTVSLYLADSKDWLVHCLCKLEICDCFTYSAVMAFRCFACNWSSLTGCLSGHYFALEHPASQLQSYLVPELNSFLLETWWFALLH